MGLAAAAAASSAAAAAAATTSSSSRTLMVAQAVGLSLPSAFTPNASGGTGVRCGHAPHGGNLTLNTTWEAFNCVDTYKVDSQIFIT